MSITLANDNYRYPNQCGQHPLPLMTLFVCNLRSYIASLAKTHQSN